MTIKFLVDLGEAHTHALKVEMEFPSSGKDEIVMPVWAPGSYLVRDFSRHLIRVESNGKLSQISKNRWLVETDQETAKIQYEIYLDELTVETSYADQSFVLINGTSLFFYVEGKKNSEAKVKFSNIGDRRISTGLEQKDDEFFARDYDQLADSPFIIGNQKIMEFEMMGKRHQIAWIGRLLRPVEKVVEDFKKIVAEEARIFAEIPYDKYVFIIITVPDDYYGGLEHKNSTVILYNSNEAIDDFGYKLFLTVVSHEFFHAWNVKRIRPTQLGPFDYTKEVYTNLLWLSEGFTSYYEWLVLWRTGIATEKEYFDHIGTMVDFYEMLPGHKNISADASSFNTWIKLYKPDGDWINNYISYYLKGELIGFALNCEIVKATNGEKSLDDLFQSLFNEFRSTGNGISKDELIDHAKRIAGDGISKVITELSESTNDISFDKYLNELGYEVKRIFPENKEKPSGFVGLIFKNEANKSIVRNSIKGYPAHASGILPGDEIVAIGGERFDKVYTREMSKELRKVKLDDLKNVRPGEKIKLTVFRRNNLINFEMTAAEEIKGRSIVKKEESKMKDKILRG